MSMLHKIENNQEMIKKEQIFLDSEKDKFWQKNALEPLPNVHECHTKLLQFYFKWFDKKRIKNKVKTKIISSKKLPKIPLPFRPTRFFWQPPKNT